MALALLEGIISLILWSSCRWSTRRGWKVEDIVFINCYQRGLCSSSHLSYTQVTVQISIHSIYTLLYSILTLTTTHTPGNMKGLHLILFFFFALLCTCVPTQKPYNSPEEKEATAADNIKVVKASSIAKRQEILAGPRSLDCTIYYTLANKNSCPCV